MKQNNRIESLNTELFFGGKSTIKLKIETEQFGIQTFIVNVERRSRKALYLVENTDKWSEKKINSEIFTLKVTENSYEFQHNDYGLRTPIHYENGTFSANDFYETIIIDNPDGNYNLYHGKGSFRDKGIDKNQSIVARFTRNKQYWWPACDPNSDIMKERLRRISHLEPKSIDHVFSQLLQFIGKESLFEEYQHKTKEYEPIAKAVLIQNIIRDVLMVKYEEIKDKDFNVALPVTMKEIKEQQRVLSDKYDPEKAKIPIDVFEQRLLHYEKENNQLLSRKTPESKPVLALIGGKQKLMTREERDKIIKSTPKNELITQIELSPIKEKFSRDMIPFKTSTTPLQIYNKLEKVLDLCTKFPNAVQSEWIEALSYDKQYRDELIRAISRQFSIFYDTFKWSSDKNTLSNSSFICILNEFNTSFRFLVKRLKDSGIKMKPEIMQSIGALMNEIEFPHHEEINDNDTIEWVAIFKHALHIDKRHLMREEKQ